MEMLPIDNLYDTYYVPEQELPICPHCGSECEWIYRDQNYVILGCENCVDRIDAYEINF